MMIILINDDYLLLFNNFITNCIINLTIYLTYNYLIINNSLILFKHYHTLWSIIIWLLEFLHDYIIINQME